jgi:hypothetical protein
VSSITAVQPLHVSAWIEQQTREQAASTMKLRRLARIGAALGMKVEDVFTQNRPLWVRLREKGGKSRLCIDVAE